MKQYLELLKYVRDNGEVKEDRTGTGTKSVFGYQMRFNLQEGFPLLTTKKLHTKSIIHELLWFLSGDTNIKYLNDNGVRIWNEWADENGDLGPVYGRQWRKWSISHDFWKSEDVYIDQIQDVIDSIRNNPNSRRHIVTAWNPKDIEKMSLPPCHCLFQFYVSNGKLSCQLYQRSVDICLGLPFNIASYALLTHIVAQQCNLDVGEFIHTSGDAHIYLNHLEQVDEQLKRVPTQKPKLIINRKPESINNYKFEDFSIVDYIAQPSIKAPIAV